MVPEACAKEEPSKNSRVRNERDKETGRGVVRFGGHRGVRDVALTGEKWYLFLFKETKQVLKL